MALIQLPQRFLTQPQYAAPIDYEGLGKGMQLLFNPACGPVDLVTGRIWTPGGDAGVALSHKGKVFSFDGVDDYFGYTGYPEITGTIGTFFMFCPKVGPNDTFGQGLLGDADTFFLFHNSGGFYNMGSPSAQAHKPWFNTTNSSVVASSRDATGAGLKLYLQGVDSGYTFAGNPVPWKAGGKLLNFGRYVAGNTWDFSGSILCIGWTSAIWGSAEAKAFHENPWHIFKAPARRLWAASSGGTAYTQSLAGSLTPSGALAKRTDKAVAGSSTAAGALSRTTGKSITGSITSAGNIVKLTYIDFAGFLTGAGGLVKRTTKTYTGSITGSGAISTMILFTASFDGSITPSGAIAKLTMKALDGASTLAGAINKKTFKALDGNISVAGVLAKLTTKAMSGSVAATGAVATSYQVLKSLAGSITPTGALAAVYIAFVAGVLKLLTMMGVGQ